MYIDDDFYDAYAEGAKKSGTPMTKDKLREFMNSLPPDDQRYWSNIFPARGDHGLTQEFLDGIDTVEVTENASTFAERIRQSKGGLAK